MMHDIGMLALSDAILLSPHELGAGDEKAMRRHVLLSVRIMEKMAFLEQEIPAVRYHHERYDGAGYPEGIAGPAIPLTARILAVADAFDAMVSPRVFRDARSVAEALGEVRRGAGAQFDPAVVHAFMSIADRFGERLAEVPGVTDRSGEPAGDGGSRPKWREGSLAQIIEAEADAQGNA
jgi:HD-GYP domain-containing protein (c-di-GMP phosphodiesterase class II)